MGYKPNEYAIIIDILTEILKETIKLQKEIKRIRTKVDSNLFRLATKYDVIDNRILVCKREYRNSVRSYVPKNPKLPVKMTFD
jgi:hypothetical protein|tara:strand:+ start:201 stop:449 length:249 start_codon:yes stop_codon:yes gene_type:complete